jgi:hypothetical protein
MSGMAPMIVARNLLLATLPAEMRASLMPKLPCVPLAVRHSLIGRRRCATAVTPSSSASLDGSSWHMIALTGMICQLPRSFLP